MAPTGLIFRRATARWTLIPNPHAIALAKLVVSKSGPFDQCEAEWHALIGRHLSPWIEECVFLLLRCVFSLISPAYKYLPTLIEMVSNKPLPLG